VSTEEAIELAKEYNATYFEVNTETGFNCNMLFAHVAESLLDAKVAYKHKLAADMKEQRKRGYKRITYATAIIYVGYIFTPPVQATFIYLYWFLFLQG
jgi:uncharacterized membrane protein